MLAVTQAYLRELNPQGTLIGYGQKINGETYCTADMLIKDLVGRKTPVGPVRELESFRAPRALQREGFPDRIGTIFRDEEEIPASKDLSDNIRDALTHSNFLIVVCAPDTPNSRWVP